MNQSGKPLAGGGRDFGPNQGDRMNRKINKLMDVAIEDHARLEYEATRGSGQGDVARYRIGAGYIGVECDRALAYKYHKVPEEHGEPHPNATNPGELQRHAESGHWTEAKTADWMRLAGFDLLTEKNGQQFGFKSAWDQETGQARLAGEVDGVIVGVPDDLAAIIPNPCIWESKKATEKKWKNFSSKGVKDADRKYYGQVQTNMAYMEIATTLFSMLNLNNMKYYWELIPIDMAYAQKLTDRAVRIIQSNDPLEFPRLTGDLSDFRCKFCDWKDKCWSVPNADLAEERPGWLGPAG